MKTTKLLVNFAIMVSMLLPACQPTTPSAPEREVVREEVAVEVDSAEEVIEVVVEPEQEEAPFDVQGELGYGETATGLLQGGDCEGWEFWGQAGDVISISMGGATREMDSHVELYDSRGELLTYDEEGGEDFDAWIDSYVLTESGDYYINACANNDLEYGLTLHGTSPGECSIEGSTSNLMPPPELVGEWWSEVAHEIWERNDLGDPYPPLENVWQLRHAFSLDGLDAYDVVSNCTYLYGADLRSEDLIAEVTFSEGDQQFFDRGRRPVESLGYAVIVYEFPESGAAEDLWNEIDASQPDWLTNWVDWTYDLEIIEPETYEARYMWGGGTWWDDVVGVGEIDVALGGEYEPDPEGLTVTSRDIGGTAVVTSIYFWDRWLSIAMVFDEDRNSTRELYDGLTEELAFEFSRRQLEFIRAEAEAGGWGADPARSEPLLASDHGGGSNPSRANDVTDSVSAPERPDSLASTGQHGGQGLVARLQPFQEMQIILDAFYPAYDQDWWEEGELFMFSKVEVKESRLKATDRKIQYSKWPSLGKKTVEVDSNHSLSDMNFIIWSSDEDPMFLSQKPITADIEIWAYDEDDGEILKKLAEKMKDKEVTQKLEELWGKKKVTALSAVVLLTSTVYEIVRKKGDEVIDRFICNPCPVTVLRSNEAQNVPLIIGQWVAGNRGRPTSPPVIRYDYSETVATPKENPWTINLDPGIQGFKVSVSQESQSAEWPTLYLEHPEAKGMLLTFDYLDLATGEQLLIKDASDNILASYTGKQGSTFVVWVNSNKITFEMQAANPDPVERAKARGFAIDKIMPFFAEPDEGQTKCCIKDQGACFYFKLLK